MCPSYFNTVAKEVIKHCYVECLLGREQPVQARSIYMCLCCFVCKRFLNTMFQQYNWIKKIDLEHHRTLLHVLNGQWPIHKSYGRIKKLKKFFLITKYLWAPVVFVVFCMRMTSHVLLKARLQVVEYRHKIHRQTSNTSRTKFQNLKCFSSRLALVFAPSIKARC